MKLLLLGLAALITFEEQTKTQEGDVTCPTESKYQSENSKPRGNLFQLRKMINRVTRKPITDYISYGCYCGWGGKGKPLDDTDRCCQIHDCCYNKLEAKKCFPKLSLYKYSVSNGQIHCGANSWCDRMSCECDEQIAYCLQKEMNTYHSHYRWYRWNGRKHCKGPTPPCSSVIS